MLWSEREKNKATKGVEKRSAGGGSIWEREGRVIILNKAVREGLDI